MKFSSVASFVGLAALVAANPLYTVTTDVEVEVVCTDSAPSTVYQTVTVTAPPTGITNAPPAYVPPPAYTPPPPFITTQGGTVTSCDYYGSLSTVYVYPTGSPSHDCTVAIYEDITIISVTIINISVTINNIGQTVTVTSTKTDHATYTPPPPPPPVTVTATTTATNTATTTATNNHAASTHLVQVGAQGQLIYGPNQVNAAVGDIVRFEFLKLNHTVTQSTFASPCTPLEGGFDTGFTHFNPTNVTTLTQDFVVSTTSPLWFYCKQAGHCGKGMVLGVNPGDKFPAFLANAEAQGSTSKTVKARSNMPIPRGARAVSWMA